VRVGLGLRLITSMAPVDWFTLVSCHCDLESSRLTRDIIPCKSLYFRLFVLFDLGEFDWYAIHAQVIAVDPSRHTRLGFDLVPATRRRCGLFARIVQIHASYFLHNFKITKKKFN
jgi:hypothetical protein